ncbi:MAG: hypothetical protein J1E65_03655 [Lachnospiraceae bacterium]|nr:hypothetical protein [Lachnospiraceae bacterium]
MKEIKKTWDFCLGNLYFELFTSGIAGILGTSIALFFAKVLEKTSFESLGPIITLIFWSICIFLTGIVEAQTVFFFMISMGKTRKSFLVSYGVVRVLHQLLGLVLVLAAALLEWILATAAGFSPVWEVTGWKLFTDGGMLALFVLGFPIVLLFLGVLYIKFKGWVFIGLWLLAMLGNCLGRYFFETGYYAGMLGWLIICFDEFLQLAPIWHILSACVCGILLIGLSWLMVRKQANG